MHREPFVEGGSGGLRLRAEGHWQLEAGRTWVAIAAILGVVAAPLRGLYHFTGGTMEEGFMLYFPEQLLNGKLPNRDFLHLYGPGSIDVLALWYRVFGVSLAAERSFGLLQHLAIIFALFTLARPWGRWAAAAVGVLSVFYVLMPIGLTAMAWNGAVALGLWSVVFALRARHAADDTGRNRCRLIAGGLAGLALTFRPDLVVSLALVHVWLLWRSGAWRRVASGLIIGLLPLFVHVALVGPMTAFRGMVIDPVFHLRSGRSLPRPPSWSIIDGALQAIAEQFPPWWKVPHLPASNALFLWFFAMFAAAFGIAVIGWRWHSTHPTRRSAVVLATGLFSIGLLPQGLQRPDSTHLTWVTFVSFPMLIPVLVELGRRRGISPRRAVLAAASAVMLLTLTVAPLYTLRDYLLQTRVSLGHKPYPFLVERNGRQFYLGGYEFYLAAQAATADLSTLVQPGERLFVGPGDLRRTWYSDVFFYYLFPELEPATYFIEMDPGLANAEGSRMPADLQTADWVIISHVWDGWLEPNTSMDYGSDDSNQVLADEFCLLHSYEKSPSHDAYLINVFQRRDRLGGSCPDAVFTTRTAAP